MAEKTISASELDAILRDWRDALREVMASFPDLLKKFIDDEIEEAGRHDDA
jgi:hypothetical protein